LNEVSDMHQVMSDIARDDFVPQDATVVARCLERDHRRSQPRAESGAVPTLQPRFRAMSHTNAVGPSNPNRDPTVFAGDDELVVFPLHLEVRMEMDHAAQRLALRARHAILDPKPVAIPIERTLVCRRTVVDLVRAGEAEDTLLMELRTGNAGVPAHPDMLRTSDCSRHPRR
jgi:hypothetical protein